MIPRKVRWRAAGFLPCLMRICFHHPLIVGLLQSSPVRSFTPNNLAGWRRHVSGLRQLLIAQSYHCFRGDLVCVFGPKLLNRLISKMRTRERKEKKKKPGKSDFQEFGNQPTSSEMSKKERKWWKKTHSGEPRTYIKGLCKYWKYSRARNPSQTHLYIQTSDKLKEKPQPLSFAVREFGGSVMLLRPESIHGCSSWSPLNCVSAKSTWMSKNHTQNQKEEGAERRGKKTMEMCQNGELIVRRHKLERGRRGQKTVVSEEETEREMYVADMLAVTLCCHLLFDRNSSSPGEFLPSVPPLSKTLQLPLLHAVPLSSPHYWQNPPKINKFTKN